MREKKVMTIQDISCVGQCSLTVALPIISACGIETAILPSAVLSTHTGFQGFTFHDLSDDIQAIANHWKNEKICFDAIYSGYLGSVHQVDDVIALMNTLLTENGEKIVDPAMADNGKLYTGFDQVFVQAMKRLCGQADVIFPNITEAALLTDSEYCMDNHSSEYIEHLLRKLGELGAKTVILKGVMDRAGQIGVIVYDVASKEKLSYYTKKIEKSSHGTGDCFASVFTGALMRGFDYFSAAKLAADFVVTCLEKTMDDPDHWYGVKFEKALPMLISRIEGLHSAE